MKKDFALQQLKYFFDIPYHFRWLWGGPMGVDQAHVPQFIKEHQRVDDHAIELYTLPVNGLDGNYMDARIYKLAPVKP
jgi:hypothetical protein